MAFLESLVSAARGLFARPAGFFSRGGLGRGLAASGLAAAHALVLVAVLGMAALPHVAAKFLRQEASRGLGREIRAESLRFNPFTFELTVLGVSVADQAGGRPMAGFARLVLDLDPAQLLAKRFTVRRFHLEDPFLRLWRDKDDHTNFADLAALFGPGDASAPAPRLDLSPARVRFALHDVRMTGGSFEFDDALNDIHHEMKDLHFDIASLANDQPGLREVLLSGGMVNESSLGLTVKADLAAMELEADLELRDVVFRRYTPYILPLKRPLDLRLAEARAWARLVVPGGAGPRLEAKAGARGLELSDAGSKVAGLEALDLEGVKGDLANGALMVERVKVRSPFIRVSRDEAGVIGLMALLEPAAVESAPGTRPRPPVRLARLEVEDGAAEVTDKGLDLEVAFHDVALVLTELDLAAARFEKLSLAAGSDRFDKLEAACSGSFAPYDLKGSSTLEGMDLARPLPLLKRLLPRLGLTGKASCALDFEILEKDGKVMPACDLDLEARDLRALAEGQAEPVLAASRAGVKGLRLDLDRRAAVVADMSLSGGGAFLRRAGNGAFPALNAMTPAGKDPVEGTSPDAWSLRAVRTTLSGFSATYADDASGASVRIDLDELAVRDASNDPARPVALSARGRAAGKAPFEISGEVRPGARSASLAVSAAGLPLAELARLAPPLPATPLSGEGGLKGRLDLALEKDGPKMSFDGDASLAGFRLAVPGKEPFASAAKMEARGARFTVSPLSFKAARIIVEEPRFGLVLDQEGRPVPPVALAARGTERKASVPSPTAAYSVDKLEVRRGRLEIAVQGYEPPLTALISGLDATLSGIGQPGLMAFDMRFLAGHTGRFNAAGRIGLEPGGLILDLKAGLKNLDLGELSPVCRRYTGFPIQRGKLGLTLDYKATAKALDLKNNIVATGVQLGPKTPGPHVKDIPLDLAVSLLADSKGVIDLDIPVTGDPAKARTDLRDVVSTAVAGAFARVLFAPLAMLKVQPGKGTTVYLPFAPGSAELGEEARKALAALGEALADRPRMSLEVAAYVDPATEKEILSKVLSAPPPAKAGRLGQLLGKTAAKQEGPVEPTLADWARLARLRQDVVLEFLAAQGKIPQERIFPLAADPLSPPQVQGQPGSRAELRLRH